MPVFAGRPLRRKDPLLSKSAHPTRNRLISGLLLCIPFVATIFIIKWLMDVAASLLRPVVVAGAQASPFVQNVPDGYVNVCTYVLSLVLLIFVIYAVGAIATFVVGRKLIGVGEAIMLRIPLARLIYSAAKQVMGAMSSSGQGAFRSVVIIEYPRAGLKTLAFFTGTVTDQAGKTYAKVFIPTPPNPASGFLGLVPMEEIEHTDMTLEEGIKMIMSGGVVSPSVMRMEAGQSPPQ